jgi:Tfp pilus assembly protein PilE
MPKLKSRFALIELLVVAFIVCVFTSVMLSEYSNILKKQEKFPASFSVDYKALQNIIAQNIGDR